MSFEGTVAGEVCRFLDVTKAAEVLWAVGLLMTQDLAKSTHDVSECRIRHQWFRKESFIRGGDCWGEVIVLNNLFFELEVLEDLGWWGG